MLVRLFVGFVVGLGFVGFSGGDVFAASSGVDEEIVVEEKREGSSDDASPPAERDRSGAPVLKPKTGGGGAGAGGESEPTGEDLSGKELDREEAGSSVESEHAAGFVPEQCKEYAEKLANLEKELAENADKKAELEELLSHYRNLAKAIAEPLHTSFNLKNRDEEFARKLANQKLDYLLEIHEIEEVLIPRVEEEKRVLEGRINEEKAALDACIKEAIDSSYSVYLESLWYEFKQNYF